uniref:Uncharacterized protein n=1 Tax=Oryza punctata TaxID=4537 RepID=A0A0E0KGI4_ORYPU
MWLGVLRSPRRCCRSSVLRSTSSFGHQAGSRCPPVPPSTAAVGKPPRWSLLRRPQVEHSLMVERDTAPPEVGKICRLMVERLIEDTPPDGGARRGVKSPLPPPRAR